MVYPSEFHQKAKPSVNSIPCTVLKGGVQMDKAVLESLKGKGREERQAFFKDHKSELVDMMLSAVNGGARQPEKENPNSDNPDPNGNYWTSFVYICNDEQFCR